MHAFPFDNWENDTADPRIPEERYAILQPFTNLPAGGTYHVNALSVYPEFCRRGIASSPLSRGRFERHDVDRVGILRMNDDWETEVRR